MIFDLLPVQFLVKLVELPYVQHAAGRDAYAVSAIFLSYLDEAVLKKGLDDLLGHVVV